MLLRVNMSFFFVFPILLGVANPPFFLLVFFSLFGTAHECCAHTIMRVRCAPTSRTSGSGAFFGGNGMWTQRVVVQRMQVCVWTAGMCTCIGGGLHTMDMLLLLAVAVTELCWGLRARGAAGCSVSTTRGCGVLPVFGMLH